MLDGYRTRLTLTSLALCTLLGAAPAPPERHSCSDLHRLYAPRALRVLRERLLIAYARAHERRATEAVEAIRRHRPPDVSELSTAIRVAPQENDDTRMKHLIAYVASNCL